APLGHGGGRLQRKLAARSIRAEGMSNVGRAAFRAELGSADFAGRTASEGARIAGSLLSLLFRVRPRDAIGTCLLLGSVTAVLINALYLQPGPHPAPIFTIKPRPVGA